MRVWVESGMAGREEKSLMVTVHGVALGGRGWLQWGCGGVESGVKAG